VHAATHQPNYRVDQPSDPFLSAEVVAGGHKKYREKRLLQSLQLILTAREYQGDAFHLAALSTVLCAQDLQELDLSPLEVWFSALNEVNPFLFSEGGDELEGSAEGAGEETSSATDQPPSLSRASSANTRGGGAGPGGNHSGKILANAILSQNETAIRQILSAFGGHLDTTHRETVVIEDADHSRIAYPLLTLAVLKGYDWLAIHLLELGADVFQRDNQFGRSCLMIICEKAAVAVLDFLWSQPHRFAIDWNRPLTDEPNQYTALQVFARFGHGFLLRRFLSAAGPVALDQAEGFHGYSPLSTALLSGQIPTAIELVLLGADVYHAAQARGATPLHIAVERGQLQVLRVMERRFRQNNNVNLFFSSLKPTDRDGFKALHVAIEYEQNHLLPFLLDELRADVNDVDNLDRLSPFAMAVLYGNIVAAKKLLTYPQLDIFHSFFDRNRLPT
jgi:ankyrin repeat protein